MSITEKIGKFEAIALLIIVMVNQIILNIPNIILISTGTSAPVNVLYITALSLLFIMLVCKLLKPFNGRDLLDISEYLGGKTLKVIIGICYLGLFFLVCTLSIRYFANSLKIIYFDSTPIVFLLILFLLPPVFLNKLGLKSISGTTLIFFPIISISLITLLLAIVSEFEIQRLFPILGYGVDATFFSGATNIFAFGGIAYLYFIPPFLKDSNDFKKISLTSIIISGIYLFLTVVSLLMSFPSLMLTDETISIYLLSRLVSIGKFLQRIDAIFILLWILSIFSLISFSFFFILQIFKKVTSVENPKEIIYCVATIVFSSSLLITNIATAKFLARTIFRYSNILLIFIISFIIILLANLKLRKHNKNNL